MVAVAFLATGCAYWAIAGHSNGLKCIYDDPICSLTVATWLLILVGAIAFMAAFAAARFAEQTFHMESRTQLGQIPCTRQDHGDEALVTIYVLETMTVLTSEPPGFSTAQYLPQRHDFENLGRAPIVACHVFVVFEAPNGAKSQPKEIALGNIGRDKYAHIKVFISKKLEKVITQWQPNVIHKGDYPLPFFPFDGVVDERVTPVTFASGAQKLAAPPPRDGQ